MNLLILGSGGREHTFAWKLSQNPEVTKIFIAPGNAGTALCGENVPSLSPLNFEDIKKFVLDHNVQLVLVGPEDPLVNGIVDFFEQDERLQNIVIIGPGRKGAQLEGSKDFAKQFMLRNNIPTAGYRSFTEDEYELALTYIGQLKTPIVLKADGLAAGKGVLICQSVAEARNGLENMFLQKKFGKAGNKVVIEEFLRGIELSMFVITDGITYKILPEAKDYKRIGENDTGLNTGGMGAVSPVPFADNAFIKRVEESIIVPTIKGLQKEEIPYKGFIFFGLMNVDGNPYLIEYNARMGDPETQAVLPRLKTDLLDILRSLHQGTLSNIDFDIDIRAAASIVLVSKGYPGNFEKGKVITGAENTAESLVFHAGTIMGKDNLLMTNGGRVMAITSLHKDPLEALGRSVKTADAIDFEGKYFRKDIGKDLIRYY